MLRTKLSAIGFALLGASAIGCAARGTVVAGASAETVYVAEPRATAEIIIGEPAPQRVVFREPPPLVIVEPDVYVVEDASYAIYFVDGFYWHVGSGARWYRSSRWDEPWVHVDLHIVPPRISHRDHHSYVHFRATASARVFRQPRERGGNDRALRAIDRRDERKARVERRVDTRKPTPAAGPKPDRRKNENARPDVDKRRSAPDVDRDLDRKRLEPPRREVPRDRVAPPRGEVDRNPRQKPAVEEVRPRPDVDQARPDDKKKKKKLDEKRKPKDPSRGRPETDR